MLERLGRPDTSAWAKAMMPSVLQQCSRMPVHKLGGDDCRAAPTVVTTAVSDAAQPARPRFWFTFLAVAALQPLLYVKLSGGVRRRAQPTRSGDGSRHWLRDRKLSGTIIYYGIDCHALVLTSIQRQC